MALLVLDVSLLRFQLAKNIFCVSETGHFLTGMFLDGGIPLHFLFLGSKKAQVAPTRPEFLTLQKKREVTTNY